MNPAYSVIFFTIATGAGYGLLAMMGMFAAGEAVPQSRLFGLAGFTLAFGAITFGLLSSIAHLGRPDRVWRAFSQWRSSWLSREAIFAVAVYPPALLFAFGWVVVGDYTGPWRMMGMISAVLSLMTVYCTAMIYATLRPVIAWSNRLTVRVFMFLSFWTGMLWLELLVRLFGVQTPSIAMVTMLAGFLAFIFKRRYWRFLDTRRSPARIESATGIENMGEVRLLEPPNVEENFVQKEMGYVVARAHAARLRRFSFLGLFAIPWTLTLLTMESEPLIGIPAQIAAVVFAMGGVVCERWLFFAEARHTAMLYYGADEA